MIPPLKNSSWSGTELSSKASFISSKLYSSLIFSRTSSSRFFLFLNPSSKISSASGPNIFARPSPSSSFGGSSTSSYILLLSSFCNAFFISSFSLVNVYVCEPYKLFEGVNAGGGESGGADGAGGMPIKSFGLSAGGGLGCAIDH